MKIYLMLCMLVLAPALGSVHAYAQAAEDHDEPPAVEGTYISRDGLTEIGFPQGWAGFEIDHGSAVVAMASKGAAGLASEPDFSVPVMMLIASEGKIDDASDLFATATEGRVECGASESQQAWINGAVGTVSEDACTAGGERLLMKSLLVETTTNRVMAAYVSHEAEYEGSIGKFNEALRSFKVFNVADSSLQSLNSSYYDVDAADTTVSVEILSSSLVAGFALDEGSRQVLLQVDQQGGAPGIAIIPAGIVLEGPYSVSIDGEAVDVDASGALLRSEPTGDQMIKLAYAPGQHEISITGARVVPEFTLVAVMAASNMALLLVVGWVAYKWTRVQP